MMNYPGTIPDQATDHRANWPTCGKFKPSAS